MSRICLYFTQQPERDRWIRGDRFVRPIIRRVIRGRPPVSGVDKIFTNLGIGLNRLGVRYEVNMPFSELRPDDKIGVMGRGRWTLEGYSQPNRIVAGPYLMGHPSQWPTICDEYPIARYLQHCEWANDICKPYFGKRCTIWAHGVDTKNWAPSSAAKDLDFLIYDKVRWEREQYVPNLIEPVRETLRRRGLTFGEIRYGFYTEDEYREYLSRARAMIFLVEHESQGSACQECLAWNVPILAWDPGWWKDPNMAKWGQGPTPASSVPYFDERCGITFKGIHEFETRLGTFTDLLNAGRLAPRDFVLENLTVEKCARRYLDTLDGVTNES